jgi:hypothetical protein
MKSKNSDVDAAARCSIKADLPITRRYTPNQLRDIWEFVRHDFGAFIELLLWLDALTEDQARVQLDSASVLNRRKPESDGRGVMKPLIFGGKPGGAQ